MGQESAVESSVVAPDGKSAQNGSTVPPGASTAAPDRPYSAHLAFLLRLRRAEAEVACREAEEVIAWWASVEARLVAQDNTEERT